MATGRVTNLQTSNQLIQQIFERRVSLETVRQQIASGIKVGYASDDTGKAGTILSLQATTSRIDRHKERISFATALLDHQEATLSASETILTRAREIATQGANGSLSFEDRRLLADEVLQLRAQMVSLANTTFQGRYIYGAADDNDPPFDAVTYTEAPLDPTNMANDRYVYDDGPGSHQTRNVQITDDDSIRVVTPGDDVFENAIAGLERLGRSLAGFRTTTDANGVPTGLGTAYTQPADYAEQTNDILGAMDKIESARVNDIIAERSDVGARIARMEQVTEILDTLKTSTEASRSTLQDTDLFEASAKFSNMQIALQALLASGAQINNLSLLNYI